MFEQKKRLQQDFILGNTEKVGQYGKMSRRHSSIISKEAKKKHQVLRRLRRITKNENGSNSTNHESKYQRLK